MAKELSLKEYLEIDYSSRQLVTDCETCNYILKFLEKNPGSRAKHIAQAIGNEKNNHLFYTTQYITKKLYKLIRMGYVKRDKVKTGKINEVMLWLPKEIIVDGEKFYSEKCENQLKKFEEKIAVFSLVE